MGVGYGIGDSAVKSGADFVKAGTDLAHGRSIIGTAFSERAAGGTTVSAGPVRLPPRRSLPRDVEIPALPGLGQTWYDRHGLSYWIRRAAMSFLWAMLTALVGLLVVSVLIAFYRRSLAAFAVFLVIEVAYTLGILGYFAVVAVRHWNDPDLAGQMFSRSRRSTATGTGKSRAGKSRAGKSGTGKSGTGKSGAGNGGAGNGGAGNGGAENGGSRRRHWLGQLLLALSCLTVGPYLALLMISVLPETPAERRARLWVAAELRGRGQPMPGS